MTEVKEKRMKKLAFVVCAFMALTAYSQTPGSNNRLESAGTQPGKAATGLLREAKANEIVHGNVTYSGIAVQIAKAHNPVQLVNPAAPPQYGSAFDNLDRDLTTGHAFGLKLFSLRF